MFLNQMDILDLKNIILKKNKSLMEEFKNRLATAEHMRRDLECRSMESIQVEAQRGKRIDKTCKSIRDIGHTHKI